MGMDVFHPCAGTGRIKDYQELCSKVLRSLNFKTKHSESCILKRP